MLGQDQIDNYHRDGVIRLRGFFDPEWTGLMRRGIERNIAHPGPFFRDHTSEGSTGRYVFDFWNWRAIPEFRKLMFDSPLGALGAEVLDRDRVLMLMDNWFLRESGSQDGAPWHHDEPYFDFEGPMCIVWTPLEPVSAEHGLTFVSGSHKWGRLYAAQQFSDNVPFDGSGNEYHRMPDFDNGEHDLVNWDMDPGDCLVFDFRTIHAATGKQNAPGTVHRMTFRLGGGDVRFEPRGEWTREISEHLIKAGQVPGKPLDNPLTPEIF